MKIVKARLGFVAVSVLVSSMLVGCGSKSSPGNSTKLNSGIINGESVADGDEVAPGTVNLYFSFPNSTTLRNFCTGTIISKTVILTAAHCFIAPSESLKISVDEFKKHVLIGFGTNVVASADDTSVVLIPLGDVTVNADYKTSDLQEAGKGSPLYDMSVIKLSKEIPPQAKIIPLLEDATQLVEGTSLTLVGFGLTQAGKTAVTATHLNKTTVKIAATINPTQFVYITEDRHSACSGDSGGPAYIRDADGKLFVAGVTSWGDETCEKFGVYTSVPAMLDWIKAQM